MRVEVFIPFLKDQVVFVKCLYGFHRVILVQFVDVVSDAGVEGGRSNWVDDCGIMGLLLVALAVGVHKKCEEAAQDGTAQAHSNHMEHVELSTPLFFDATGSGHRNFWDKVGIKNTWPALGGISGALISHRKQEEALASPDLHSRIIAGGPA